MRSMENVKLKSCAKCGSAKPLAEFYTKRVVFGKSSAFCWDCRFPQREPRIPNRRGHVTRNPHRIEGDVAYIGLTDSLGKVKAEVLVDAGDVELVLSFGRWHASTRQHTAYAMCGKRTPEGMKQVFLHHVLIPGIKKSDGLTIDHANGNGLDNRRSNLRVFTRSENARNIVRRKTKSGHQNVIQSAKGDAWYVYFSVNGKPKHFGTFYSLEKAVAKAAEVRRELHPMSRLNT